VKATHLLACIALVFAACATPAPGTATFEVDGNAESIVNPHARMQAQDIEIEGERTGIDPAHDVVFSLDVPIAPGAFDCTSMITTATYYEPVGNTPGEPSFVAPTWAASRDLPGTSCSGEWRQQGSRMVGSLHAIMTQLLVKSTQTREASGTFDVPMPN
jgi:hypothetical protein